MDVKRSFRSDLIKFRERRIASLKTLLDIDSVAASRLNFHLGTKRNRKKCKRSFEGSLPSWTPYPQQQTTAFTAQDIFLGWSLRARHLEETVSSSRTNWISGDSTDHLLLPWKARSKSKIGWGLFSLEHLPPARAGVGRFGLFPNLTTENVRLQSNDLPTKAEGMDCITGAPLWRENCNGFNQSIRSTQHESEGAKPTSSHKWSGGADSSGPCAACRGKVNAWRARCKRNKGNQMLLRQKPQKPAIPYKALSQIFYILYLRLEGIWHGFG